MALLTVDFLSTSLMRTVQVKVLLPTDKLPFPGVKEAKPPYKTLYLLHGIFGNCTDWITGSGIVQYAQDHNLAVVMPSGENLFYVDYPDIGANYGAFIGKELVEQTRKMFPLSTKREDTFIGGLSMGGYGALRNGLKYADTFGYITAFSSALILDDLHKSTNDSPIFLERRDYLERIFGDLDRIHKTDKDPLYLAKELIANHKSLPKVYLACGTKDSLEPANLSFYRSLQELGFDVTYDAEEYGHEWTFWDHEVKKAIAWLPHDDDSKGISSGNVGI